MRVRSMSNDFWRWADPGGQQRRVRLDELRAALAGGHIAPNTPVWRSGWKGWQPAHEVPELTSSALSAANGIVPNIPPPPLAMLQMQHEFEAKAGGSFSPPPMGSIPPAPPAGEEEPPPPPQFVPLPVKASSIPTVAPSSGKLPSIAPSLVGAIQPSLPTTIGLPPPPEMLALANARAGNAPAPANGPPAKDPMIEELSGSMLLDDSAAMLGPPQGGFLPPTDPIMREGSIPDRPSLSDDDLNGLPRRKPNLTAIFDDFQEIKAGRAPKNKLLIGVVAVVALSVMISLLALVVSLFRSKPSELPTASTSSRSTSSPSSVQTATTPTTTASAAEPAAASATPAPSVTVAADVKPAASEPTLGDCVLAGEAHVVSPRAFVQSGVEAVVVPGAIALGFAIDPREGRGVTVDPASIGITTTVKARALGGDARRMSPVLEKGKLTLVPGVDKKVDKLQGRRVVGTNPAIDLGVAVGGLVWAPRDGNSYAKLFPLEGDGPVEAIRAIPLPSKGIAVAFRRGNAVYVGTAKGDAVMTADGALSRIAGLGQVGSPNIAVSGDTVVVAWSDRASAQEPWQVRWAKMSVGGAPDAPKQLTLPDGGLGTQAMSPSVAGLGGGRFVMTWSEGRPQHQVRAITINADGTPSGAALALSAAGVDAGQPQVAVGADGRGVIAFLAGRGKAFEVHATPITCAAK